MLTDATVPEFVRTLLCMPWRATHGSRPLAVGSYRPDRSASYSPKDSNKGSLLFYLGCCAVIISQGWLIRSCTQLFAVCASWSWLFAVPRYRSRTGVAVPRCLYADDPTVRNVRCRSLFSLLCRRCVRQCSVASLFPAYSCRTLEQ